MTDALLPGGSGIAAAWASEGLLFRELECNFYNTAYADFSTNDIHGLVDKPNEQWVSKTIEELIDDCLPYELHRDGATSLLSMRMAKAGASIYSAMPRDEAYYDRHKLPFGNKTDARVGLVFVPSMLAPKQQGNAFVHDAWTPYPAFSGVPRLGGWPSCDTRGLATSLDSYVTARLSTVVDWQLGLPYDFTCYTSNWTMAAEQQRAFLSAFWGRSPRLPKSVTDFFYNQFELKWWGPKDVRGIFIVEDEDLNASKDAHAIARELRSTLDELGVPDVPLITFTPSKIDGGDDEVLTLAKSAQVEITPWDTSAYRGRLRRRHT